MDDGMKLKKAKGFTLMEVMIAIAILAIALVSIFQLQSQSISMSTDSRFMTTAALLAQSKMVEIETASPLSDKIDDGDFVLIILNIHGIWKSATPSYCNSRELKSR